jgi:ketosteroid isomerase-like protein
MGLAVNPFDLVRRLERLEAELALRRLAHDYCIAADTRDLDLWSMLWLQDAVWEVSPDQIFTGIDEIRIAVQEQWRAFEFMQHSTTNHVVEIGGDEATGRAEVIVFVKLGEERWVTGGGTYVDRYRRNRSEWRIAARRVVRPFDLPLAAAH